MLSNSSVSNEINHYQVKFYNDDTLLETQIRLEGNRATYPTVIPTKEGYDFLGYALDKNVGKIYIKGLNLPPRQSVIDVVLKK